MTVWGFFFGIFLWIAGSCAVANPDDMLRQEIQKIDEGWTETKYQIVDKKAKVEGYEQWARYAEQMLQKYPKQPELLAWLGICYASEADILKISALSYAKKAKTVFEELEQIDPAAMNAAAYTNLGVLYHRVPGFPLGFGNMKKAEDYFQKALQVAPDDVDANYFYALFLISQKNYKNALQYLQKALHAPQRNRPLADAMRHKEVEEAIVSIQNKIK